MSTKQTIDTLWQEFRDAINKTYEQAKSNDPGAVLRDYAENISWNDALSALVGRESANERQHRNNRPSPKGFSIDSAAKLILMNSAVRGAEGEAMPPASDFLIFRQTAVEAGVVGYLVREQLSQDWRDRVENLDYARLME